MPVPTPTPKTVPQRYRPKTPVTEIKPHPKNYRRGKVDQIQTSLATIGWYGAVIVQESTGLIIAGRHRWEAAQAEGHATLPAFWVDVDDAQAVKIMLADNRMSDIAANDEEAVQALLREIFETEGTLAGTGYTADDLDKQVSDALQDLNESVRAPKKPQSQHGDIWVMGPHRLAVGSNHDPELWKALMGDDRAAMVWTDPPYGVEYSSDNLGGIQGDDLTGQALVDLLSPAFRLASGYARPDAGIYIWHASTTRREFERAMLLAEIEEKQYIIWAKEAFVLGRSDFHWQHEPCYYAQKQGQKAKWYGGRDQATVWRIAYREGEIVRLPVGQGILLSTGAGTELYLGKRPPKKSKKLRTLVLRDGEELQVAAQHGDTDTWNIDTTRRNAYDHPTQKPVALAVRSISYSSKASEIVVDCFAGSGTLLIAAEATTRKARVIEKDTKWADVICRRYQRLTGEMPVHEGRQEAVDFETEEPEHAETE